MRFGIHRVYLRTPSSGGATGTHIASCVSLHRVIETAPRATRIGSDATHPGIEGVGTYRTDTASNIRATSICIQEIASYSREIGIYSREFGFYRQDIAGCSREIGFYRQEIASYSRKIGIYRQEIAICNPRNAAATVETPA